MTFFPVLNSPTTAYSVQPGCGFLDPRYYASERAVHPAVDFNAVTGADTDLGDPVYAADDGVVIDVAWGSYIGGIIEILHDDGSISGYWHERDIHVRKGQRVKAGDMIGQMGKGALLDMKAHCHFYVKKAGVQLPSDYWVSKFISDRGRAEAFVRENYHEPLGWLTARGASKRLSDLQALRNDPTRVLVFRADQPTEITGQLSPFPDYGVTLDGRGSTVRLYLNPKPQPTDIPVTPPTGN
ncbi:MAG: M23 family metallopeptidase [Deinococcus sp.]|nr:M23 family metallopeptidase [Deinococcus sp.]